LVLAIAKIVVKSIANTLSILLIKTIVNTIGNTKNVLPIVLKQYKYCNINNPAGWMIGWMKAVGKYACCVNVSILQQTI